MKKIAVFVNLLVNSGPINVVYDILHNIDRTKFEPIIFVLRKNLAQSSVIDKFINSNIKVIFLNYSFVKMELRAKKCAKEIETILLSENITLVHSNTYNSAIILSKVSKKIKKIITFHNICNEDFPRQKGIILGNYMSLRYLRAVRKFEYKVGISEVVSRFYNKKSKDSSIVTIHNGIDCNKFSKPSEEYRNCIREKYGVNNKIVYIIVGTISKLKNIPYIINTIKKLNDNSRVFYFIGSGPIINKCKEYVKGCKNIIFTGQKMDIKDYLAIADFSISASKTEGFGLAALEVIMSGVTLIYSNCNAFKELFYENQLLKPYMFSLNEKNSLLEKIIKSEKIKDIDDVISFYKEKFDSRIMSEKYQMLYDEIKSNI